MPLFNIQTGEVIFGGVGAGLYGILMYAILAVFIAGLMVGRTPEYLGKKIESKEVKMAMLAMIATSAQHSGLQRHHFRGSLRLGQEPVLESRFRKSEAGAYGQRSGYGQPEQQRSARIQRNSVRLYRAAPTTTAARSPASM